MSKHTFKLTRTSAHYV